MNTAQARKLDEREMEFDPKTFDPTTLDYTENPQAYFAQIHGSTPIFYSDVFRAWMIYDFAVGKLVLSDKRFSRNKDDRVGN